MKKEYEAPEVEVFSFDITESVMDTGTCNCDGPYSGPCDLQCPMNYSSGM